MVQSKIEGAAMFKLTFFGMGRLFLIGMFVAASAFWACKDNPAIPDFEPVPLAFTQIEKFLGPEGISVTINELLGPKGATCTTPTMGKYVVKGEYDFAVLADELNGQGPINRENTQDYLQLGFGTKGQYVLSDQENFVIAKNQYTGAFNVSVVLKSTPAPEYLSLLLVIDNFVTAAFLVK